VKTPREARSDGDRATLVLRLLEQVRALPFLLARSFDGIVPVMRLGFADRPGGGGGAVGSAQADDTRRVPGFDSDRRASSARAIMSLTTWVRRSSGTFRSARVP
jgi:hypothetical protein